jgi:hypothetical protein
MRNYRIMYEELLKEHNRTLVELVELRLLRSGAQQVTEAASLLALNLSINLSLLWET